MVSMPSLCTRLLRVPSISTWPLTALPLPSCRDASQMAPQVPMSDQGKTTGSTPAIVVRSITA